MQSTKMFYYENNRDKLLDKQNIRYMKFEELIRNYAELQIRFKAMEEKITIKGSEKKPMFIILRVLKTEKSFIIK